MKHFLLKDDSDKYHIVSEKAIRMEQIPLVVGHGTKEQVEILKQNSESKMENKNGSV